MLVLVDRVVTELDTQNIATYALLMRHHFDAVLAAYSNHGPVQIKYGSPQEALRTVQMLNRHLICLKGFYRAGVRVHARGPYVVAVSACAQLESVSLYTVDKNRNFRMPASKQMH
jgi:hypothetical protein